MPKIKQFDHIENQMHGLPLFSLYCNKQIVVPLEIESRYFFRRLVIDVLYAVSFSDSFHSFICQQNTRYIRFVPTLVGGCTTRTFHSQIDYKYKTPLYSTFICDHKCIEFDLHLGYHFP